MRRATLLAVLAAAVGGCAGVPSAWIGMSPDHRRTFTVADENGRACLRLDDAPERCFDGVSLSRIVFSPDSRSVAYAVEQDGGWVVVRDGRPGPVEDGVGELVFSPLGDALAYTALRGGRWHVVVDGAAGEAYDSLFSGTLTFDPSGRRIAYAAFRRGSAFAVVDHVPGPPHDGIARLRFSPDGRRAAYVARSGDEVRLVLDGAAGPAHDAIAEYVFDPDGEGVSYAAAEHGDWWVSTGDGRLGPYLEVRNLSYRPSDGRLVFVARASDGEWVVAGGVPGPAHESVDPPVFSERGSRWGYVAHDSATSTVILDGEVFDVRDWALDLALSDAGDRWAYVTRRGDADVVMDDRGVTELDMVVDGTLQFVRGGAAWACLAGDLGGRRLFVRVEGRDEVRPFSWGDFGGVAGSRGGAPFEASASLEALRSWVAAEAELILTASSLTTTYTRR